MMGGSGGAGRGAGLGSALGRTVDGSGETIVRAIPQFAQNRLPAGLDVPQFGHTITDYLPIIGRACDETRAQG